MALVCGHSDEISRLEQEVNRFSLNFYEWTSNRNRQYMCMNVHVKVQKFWNLGMIQMHESMLAEKCIKLLKSKLSDFGLSLIMISYLHRWCKLTKVDQRLCYAHGIQLAVLYVLYDRQTKTAVNEVQSEVINEVAEDRD